MTLSLATVTPAFIPGSTNSCYGSSLVYAGLPHTNEHLCYHMVITILLTSDLLSPRPGWNRRWCYHRQAPITLCDNRHSVGNVITVPSGINPRATVASIKVLFRGIKASFHTRFALAHAHTLGILHYREHYIASMYGILLVSHYNATVKAAFMPDSTLDLFPIFSVCKLCAFWNDVILLFAYKPFSTNTPRSKQVPTLAAVSKRSTNIRTFTAMKLQMQSK